MMAERLAEIRRDLDSEAYTSYLPKTVRELLDHIARLEAQRGGAVVVAEPTVKQWIKEVLDAAYNDPEPHATMRAATKWFRENSKAIPANQVLADGMVEVDRDYLSDLEEAIIDAVERLEGGFVLCENCGEQEETKTMDVMSMDLMPMKARIDALRSAKGATTP